MEILKINLLEKENSPITNLEGKIRKVKTEIWKSEMANKETLRLYMNYKKKKKCRENQLVL